MKLQPVLANAIKPHSEKADGTPLPTDWQYVLFPAEDEAKVK